MTINEEEVRTRLHRFADQARTAPLGQPWTAAPSGIFPRRLIHAHPRRHCHGHFACRWSDCGDSGGQLEQPRKQG